MKKRLLFLSLVWFTINFCSTASATIYYYSGTMDASFTVEDSIEISIPAGIAGFTYYYPLPQIYDYDVNSQSVDSPQLTFSPSPDISITNTDEFGNQYLELFWNNPSPGTITGTVTYSISNTANLDKFTTSDLFPLNSNLTQEFGQFLEATEQVQSDNTMITYLASSLTNGLDQEWEAVLAICGWVRDNITYGPNQNVDAVSTYIDKVGVCANFSHLSCAILRAAGIPAKYVTGYSLSKSYTLPYNWGSFNSINWNQGPHAWVDIFYPSLGWIPYDPQRDLYHIDTHRICYGAGKDNDSLIAGSSQWYYSGNPPDTYPKITTYPTINWISDNIDLTFVKEGYEINNMVFSALVNFIPTESISISLTPGWNLVSSGTGFDAADKLSDKEAFKSVWKWENNKWAVYLPGLKTSDYAGSKEFNVLDTINPGEGFWVNSVGSETISIPGTQETGSLTLTQGWNLVGLRDSETKTITDLITGNEQQITSIWKWTGNNWAVYLPGEEDGGASYAQGKDFILLEDIHPGEGFWVNTTQDIVLE